MIECLSVDDTITCFDVVKQVNYYLIALAIETGEIILWKYLSDSHESSKNFSKIYNHQNVCDCIKFSANGLYLASCSENRVKERPYFHLKLLILMNIHFRAWSFQIQFQT